MLSVAGIVRPRDISTDNTVSYDKIAEARISYGGRGRITEVQQPALGPAARRPARAVLSHGDAEADRAPTSKRRRGDRRQRAEDGRSLAGRSSWRMAGPDRRCGRRRRPVRPAGARPGRDAGAAGRGEAAAGRPRKAAYSESASLQAAAADRHQSGEPRAHAGSGSRPRSSSTARRAGRQRAGGEIARGHRRLPAHAVARRRSRAPSGFQHLREDLNERARMRSGGKVARARHPRADGRMTRLSCSSLAIVLLLRGRLGRGRAGTPSLEPLMPAGDAHRRRPHRPADRWCSPCCRWRRAC